MDFGDLGKLLAGIAPTIATVLGGPLAGAAASVLADALGTDASPASIGAAIEKGGDDVKAALGKAEETAAARWGYMAEQARTDAAQSQAINATMQAELARGLPWWAWRNLWGYSVTIECALVGCEILWELRTGDFKAITAFMNLTGFFMTWYGMRIGVLGFIYNGASNEKIAAVTGHVPGVVGQIIKAVTKK